MNNKKQNLALVIENLDNLSDGIIKNSFLGKIFNWVVNIINKLQGGIKPHPYSFTALLISIGILFVSLLLPQFANDRFGVGVIIMFCFSIFLFNLLTCKTIKVNFNILDFLLIVILFLSIISTFSSYFFKESIIGLLKYIVFFLFYIMLKTTILNSSYKTVLNFWLLIYFGAIVVSLVGIYQYIIGVEPLATWEDPNYENIHTRVYSTLGNPNLLAGYLLTILPISIALPFEIKTSLLNKVFILFGSILIFACLILTGSRGGYMGLICGIFFSIIIFLNYLTKNKSLANQIPAKLFIASFVIIIFVISTIYLFPLVTERMSTIFTIREHSSNNFRVNVWLGCLKMLKENILFGIGPGNHTFRLAYGLYMISGFDALAAYNIFLEFAVETGIFGCMVFIFIFLISLLKLHYLFWEKHNILAFGIFISLVSIITHGMVDSVFFRPQVYIPFWYLVASIAKLEIRELEK